MVRIKSGRGWGSMARWPLLCVALLLAGCSSPQSDTVPPDDVEPAPEVNDGTLPGMERPDGPYQEVLVFTGQMTGTGYVTPVQNGFVGIITMPQSFYVDEGATRLAVEMTWDVPGFYYLDVEGPDGQVFMDHQLPQSKVIGAITYVTEEVPEGGWEVMARAQGPAAVQYVITATIDYA